LKNKQLSLINFHAIFIFHAYQNFVSSEQNITSRNAIRNSRESIEKSCAFSALKFTEAAWKRSTAQRLLRLTNFCSTLSLAGRYLRMCRAAGSESRGVANFGAFSGGIKGKRSASRLIDNYISDQVISCCSLSLSGWQLAFGEERIRMVEAHSHTLARTIINRRGWVRERQQSTSKRKSGATIDPSVAQGSISLCRFQRQHRAPAASPPPLSL
jgi:hypothetical protein